MNYERAVHEHVLAVENNFLCLGGGGVGNAFTHTHNFQHRTEFSVRQRNNGQCKSVK